MIPKKEPITSTGAGRPFEMYERSPEPKTDAERQKPIVITLTDLNGDETGNNVPKSFSRKAGRVLPSFTKYWTKDEEDEDGDGDID